MKQVGVFEAKTNLSRLIEQVEKGETVTITRNGKPVAKLVGAQAHSRFTPEQISQRRKALLELRDLGRSLNLRLTHEEIKRSIEEGRR